MDKIEVNVVTGAVKTIPLTDAEIAEIGSRPEEVLAPTLSLVDKIISNPVELDKLKKALGL